MVSSYISPKAVMGRASDIARRGLMAVAAIATGEIVAIKGGHIVDTATLRSLPQALQEAEIQIADGFHLAALDEELTTDYALFDDYDGAMTCYCGTASCRGTIGGRDWQRPELQRRYGPYFSTYLQQRFAGGAAPRPLGHRPGG